MQMALTDISASTGWAISTSPTCYTRSFTRLRECLIRRYRASCSKHQRYTVWPPSNIHFKSLEEINDENFGPTHLYAPTKVAVILGKKFLLPEKVIKENGGRVYNLPRTPRDGQHQYAATVEGCISRSPSAVRCYRSSVIREWWQMCLGLSDKSLRHHYRPSRLASNCSGLIKGTSVLVEIVLCLFRQLLAVRPGEN